MAMTPDLATFRAIYPELAGVPDATVTLWLEEAKEELSEGAWGACYGRAVLSYAAHNIALGLSRAANTATDENGNTTQAPAGAVVSASAEGLSVSFAQPAGGSSADSLWWQQTPYGQTYLAAQRQCLGRGGLSW